MAVWETTEKGAKDWAKFDKTSDKIAAVGIDATFVAAKTLFKHYGAHLATTAAVGLLVAWGAPAVGVAAVGLLAWWGGSYLTGLAMDSIYNWAETSGAKDAAVGVIGSGLDAIGEGVRNTGEAVDRAFKNVISNFFE